MASFWHKVCIYLSAAAIRDQEHGGPDLCGEFAPVSEENIMTYLRAICSFIYELVFGCGHDHVTRPFTLQSHSYKVCLDCGRHIPYSLEKMRPLRTREFAKDQSPITALIPAPLSMVDIFAEENTYHQTEAVA